MRAKGKIVDLLAREARVIVRFQGEARMRATPSSPNAERLSFTSFLRGFCTVGRLCVLGNGVAMDPGGFIEELDGLIAKGIKVGRNLVISDRAHLIMPYHKAIDRAAEEAKGARRIGTTGRGIGPAYVDKMARIGMRAGDLLNPEVFKRKLKDNLVEVNSLLASYSQDRMASTSIKSMISTWAMRIDCTDILLMCLLLLQKMIKQGHPILFEGAQGTHLDIDFGTYPYVTSSSSSAGGACIGAGVGPTKIEAVLGVTKAYTTRVGGGPFPTELTDEVGEGLKVERK